MFKRRIINRLMAVFLLFAALVVIPFSITVLKQVDRMVAEEESLRVEQTAESAALHRDFSGRLIQHMIPFVFYILVMSFLFSIFFLRKTLRSLRQLQKGSVSLRDGNLDTRLEVITDDELGEATRAFNDMAASLREKTLELSRKDVYINAMLDPLWVVDEYNNLTDINPAFTRLFGYGREEVIGMSIYDFFDEKNAAIMRRQLEENREKGIASIYEISIRTKAGEQMPVLISGSPIYSEGKLVGKIGVLKDFREQGELRDELRRSKEFIETITDSIEDRLLVIDRDYRIVRANKAAEAHAGRALEGRSCYEASHDLSRPCRTEGYDCPVQIVFITGKNYSTTHQFVGPAGERRYHEVTASPVRDPSGDVMHVIELIRDVTERMMHEEEIFQKNRELVALNSVAELLSGSLLPEEIFAKVLDKMIEMLGLDGGGIFLLDEQKKEMICHYHRGISEEFVKLMGRIRLGEDIPGRVALTGQLISTPDLTKDQRIERSIIKHSGIKGYCCIPVRGKERIIGVFCLFSFRLHEFTLEEEKMLTSIGEMTGIAIENIRLYEQMRELYEYQRKRREDEQAQMLSLSSQLGSSIELKDVMGRVMDVIRRIFGADFAWLLVNDAEGNFVLKSSATPTEYGNAVIYPAGVSSIEGYSVDRRTPTLIRDIRGESKFYIHPEIANLACQSVISVPLHIGDKTVGVYSLYYMGSKDFKEEDLHFLRIIANILAVSLERSDYYAKAIMEKGLGDTILQSVSDGIITVDTGGRTVSMNKAFERMTGLSAAGAVGLPVCDVFRYTEDNVDFRLALDFCFDSALEGGGTSRETEITTVSGKRLLISISSSPVLDRDGSVKGVVNLVRDISREKEIDMMKTEIIRSVSHEFRTPLSAIVGMTEMILEGDVEESRSKKYLNTILSEGMRLSRMVSDLLSIARIESGRDGLKLEVVDVKRLLADVVEPLSSLSEKKKAVIRFETNGPERFVADGEKIKQLLINLIDNSLMFSDEGCTIVVTVEGKKDHIEMTVSDSGWGIHEEDMPHIAERFFRGRHGARIKGTGLGLFLCKEIARIHGGKMEITSKPGIGTNVIFSLPYLSIPARREHE